MRLTIAALLAISSLAGAGHAATRSIPVPAFAKLRVEGPYVVRVRTGQSTSVRASGPADRLDRLVVESRDGTLIVTSEKGWSWHGLNWDKSGQVLVDVGVPTLASVELTLSLIHI